MVKKIPIHNASKAKMSDPNAVLALSILNEAKKDAQMWNDFIEEWGTERKNFDSHWVALWVMEWIEKHRQQATDMGIDEYQIKSLSKEGKK